VEEEFGFVCPSTGGGREVKQGARGVDLRRARRRDQRDMNFVGQVGAGGGEQESRCDVEGRK